ncbi:DUF4012 domain-containing protein [Nocardioides sp.]|uniref:DUF4012 domain-containing protein n=1 Tax=Nocardioides sp. TaxID=35761 RepID=UPI00378380EA
MQVSRRSRLVGVVVLALVVLAGAWIGWQVWSVSRDVSAAADDATALRAAVLAQDAASQQAELRHLREHSAAAAGRTDGLTWKVLEHLPYFGDDARGAAVASSVVADLAQDGIAPLLDVTQQMDALVPRDATVSVSAASALRAPVESGDAAFASAERRLSSQDPGSFTGRLRDKYRELESEVRDAHDVLAGASTAMDLMPSMLGGDGPRHYLLVFQNNAEIRSTGGLPGAVSLVSANDGKVEMTRQVAASSFGERSSPVLALTPAERQIYGEQLGTYFPDANFTPDFGRSAALMQARWEERYGGTVDGVVSLDPVALSYLLGATGPVTVGDTELTADNAVELLLHQVYLEHPDPAAQDAYFRQVARAVFDAVSRGTDSPVALAQALGRAAREHRIYVHSFHPDEQRLIDETSVAGALTDAGSRGPQVGVYLNDATGSKMSYYLRYGARLDANYCTDEVQALSGSMRLSSTAPPNAARLPRYVTGGGAYGTEPGNQLVLVRLYGPVGGSISDVQLRGRPMEGITVVPQDGRPVATVPVELSPGDTVDLTWQMQSGAGQVGDAQLTVTPGISPGLSSWSSVSACA